MADKAELLNQLLDHSPGVIYAKHLGSKIFEFVSPAVKDLTGLSQDTFQRLSHEQFLERIHPEDRLQMEKYCSDLSKNDIGDIAVLHYRFRKEGGKYQWVKDHVRIVHDENGEPNRIIGNMYPVDNLQTVHTAPKPIGTDDLLTHPSSMEVLNVIHEGIWQLDGHHQTVYANQRMAEMLGFSVEEMMGKSLFDFMDTHARQKAHLYIERRNQGIKEEHTFEFIKKNGERLYAHLNSLPILDDANNYQGVIAAIADISEIRNTQKQLEHQQELMHDIADYLPGLIMTYVLHPDGTDQILFISKGVEDLYEVSAEEAMRDPTLIWNKIHPEDLENMQQSVLKSARELSFWYVEFRAVMDDGSIKWLCGYANPKKLDSGAILWHTLTLDDTSRKQVENQLKLSEKRLELALRGANDAHWDYDLVNDTLFYSDRWWNMFGYKPNEVPSDASLWKKWTHPDDLLRVENTLKNAIDSGKDSFIVESRRRHKEGFYVPVLGRGLITRDEAGRAVRVTGTLFDMTRIKQAESLLRESEAMFRSIVEGANAVIYTFSPQLEFTYISPSAPQSTGYSVDELFRLSPLDIIHPDDHKAFRAFVWKMESSRMTQRGLEFRIIKKDGSIVWRNGSVAPLLDDENEFKGFIGISQDIDELKQKEKRLAEAIAMKDKLFSIIGHDLKSPLNSILGLTEVMAENVHKGEIEEVKELFDWVRIASHKSVNLLNNLLEWARSQAGMLPFSPQPLELRTLVGLVLDINLEAAEEKNIQLILDVPEHTWVSADENMLRTILRNLLSNAIKYTFENGKIRIKAEQQHETVLISVQDNGTGMSQQSISKLFTLQPPDSLPGTRREKGTGLGLMLCHDFVEKLGGRIWVESEENKGSTFFFTLAASQPSQEIS
jgi:PAS domain S-box-containing protein